MRVGTSEGNDEGKIVGVLLGTKYGVRVIGLKVGKRVCLIEGANVGVSEGESEGCCVGYEMVEYL